MKALRTLRQIRLSEHALTLITVVIGGPVLCVMFWAWVQ